MHTALHCGSLPGPYGKGYPLSTDSLKCHLGPPCPTLLHPCVRATPEMALQPFWGWPACRAGGLWPSCAPLDNPRRTGLVSPKLTMVCNVFTLGQNCTLIFRFPQAKTSMAILYALWLASPIKAYSAGKRIVTRKAVTARKMAINSCLRSKSFQNESLPDVCLATWVLPPWQAEVRVAPRDAS
jgi:hypothetical protein